MHDLNRCDLEQLTQTRRSRIQEDKTCNKKAEVGIGKIIVVLVQRLLGLLHICAVGTSLRSMQWYVVRSNDRGFNSGVCAPA